MAGIRTLGDSIRWLAFFDSWYQTNLISEAKFSRLDNNDNNKMHDVHVFGVQVSPESTYDTDPRSIQYRVTNLNKERNLLGILLNGNSQWYRGINHR
jgi:hypothetical protein